MKRYLMLCACVFSGLMYAQECDFDCESTIWDKMYISVKPGYSYLTKGNRPEGSRSGYSVRGEFGIPLALGLDLWLDGGYTSYKHFHYSSYTLGVKRQFEISCTTNLYLGMGARYFNGKSKFHKEKSCGGAVTVGSLYYFFGREAGLFLDLFLDYGWNGFDKVDTLTSGLGLGTNF